MRAGGNAVIVPWSETIYYGRQQNGYHGGATPQEMVCPLVILTDKSSAYSGLFPCEYPKPEWWSSAPTATATVEEPPVSVTVPKATDEPVRQPAGRSGASRTARADADRDRPVQGLDRATARFGRLQETRRNWSAAMPRRTRSCADASTPWMPAAAS